MTDLTFTLNDDGLYEATLNGFTGTLQVDREIDGHVVIYGRLAYDMLENVIYTDKGKTMLASVDMSSDVSMRITCTTPVSKASYVDDNE